MDGLEFQPFAPMDGHQADGIHVKSRGRNLAKIALFGEKNELPHPVKSALDGSARAERAAIADEVEKLPKRHRPHAVAHGVENGKTCENVGSIEQIGRKEFPRGATRRNSGEVGGESR